MGSRRNHPKPTRLNWVGAAVPRHGLREGRSITRMSIDISAFASGKDPVYWLMYGVRCCRASGAEEPDHNDVYKHRGPRVGLR